MNFQDYMLEQFKKTPMLTETIAESGETSVFKGSEVMGKHHHNYLVWSVETGYGYTGDAISDVDMAKPGPCVPSHVHLIVDGKIWPLGDGHTHEMEKPKKRAADVDIGSSTTVVVTTPGTMGLGV